MDPDDPPASASAPASDSPAENSTVSTLLACCFRKGNAKGNVQSKLKKEKGKWFKETGKGAEREGESETGYQDHAC